MLIHPAGVGMCAFRWARLAGCHAGDFRRRRECRARIAVISDAPNAP